jgi:cardiolipin synthase
VDDAQDAHTALRVQRKQHAYSSEPHDPLSAPCLQCQLRLHSWLTSPAVPAQVTDWLDGYVARKQGLTSALGSYLDPLADKILIGCVVGALAAKALIPTWVAAVVIGRDVALVSGGFLMRGRQVGWRWPGASEFFKVEGSGAQGLPGIPAARRMKPSWISKVNTVLQLGFVGCCITQAWYGWPAVGLLEEMEMLVVATTLVSGLGYVKNVMKAD